jgi:hydrogenase nickel incorporation protein HypA/HybF
MHEYSLVESLMDRVEQEARARNALSVSRVHVRLGPQATVEEGVFATAFEAMRTGTICKDAELVLRRDGGAPLCAACGHPLPSDGVLVCPKCDCTVHHAPRGDLTIERVDLEFS